MLPCCYQHGSSEHPVHTVGPVNPDAWYSLDDIKATFAHVLEDGYDSCTLVATPQHPTVPLDSSPYVQSVWREDGLVQLEVIGDHYLGFPYSECQVSKFELTGFAKPFMFGDEFPNWTQLINPRTINATDLGALLVNSLWLATHDLWTAFEDSLVSWDFNWVLSDTAVPWHTRMDPMLPPTTSV
jgi:hypothetical protein